MRYRQRGGLSSCGWIDYRWINPVTNQIQPKQSYVEKVKGTGYVVYIGIYR